MRCRFVAVMGLALFAACSESESSKQGGNSGGTTSAGNATMGGRGGAAGSEAGGRPLTSGGTGEEGGSGSGAEGSGGAAENDGGQSVSSSGAGASAGGGAVGAGGSLARGGSSGDAGTPPGGSSGSGGGCGSCDWDCCGATCVNKGNDVLNCGGCGIECAPGESCNEGVCGEPPCDDSQSCDGGGFCCGASCCETGMLCCVVPGPVGPSLPTCSAPNALGTCALGCRFCRCASADTPIATPRGDVPIAELGLGDLVYSVDRDAIVAVPLVALQRQPAGGHAVPQLLLDNQRTLEISAGHPTADGRTFGELSSGDRLGDVAIVRVVQVPYRFEATYDILPASSTGTYFAAGAWVGSTLGPLSPANR